MKRLYVTAALSIALAGWLSAAGAEPRKDDSGKEPENGYQRDDNGWRQRAEAGRLGCKTEWKWDGVRYRDEVTCKDGSSPPLHRN
ncbi:hypothetical protein LG047_03450 [Methylocystis sp. WRRC1]|uniref:hypothetical protein n=1 Tax=Methylocystis sp. WRRC1 TaxID=1732014 RepID=UPI001D14E887|nr:hypothetical protein [Methylocystis sp. WRRC1]MCC3244388.1 hypothetical protein [Methylocystis sp. WRRC1]